MVLYKIFARIDNKLYTKLKKLKANYSMKWTDLFFHLCSTIPQSNLMIQNYAPFYGVNEDHNFTIQVEAKTYRIFLIFAATFKNNAHAIDYLVNHETNKDDFEEGDFTKKFRMDLV